MYKKGTVVFDFDGVIHSYISGWSETPNDPPVKYIKEEIDLIRKEGYEVVVVSTRCDTKEGKNTVIEYLAKHNIQVDRVTDIKPPALAYIDDRAIKFDGNAKSLLYKIQNFIPWTKNSNSVKKFVGQDIEQKSKENEKELKFNDYISTLSEDTKEFLYKFVSILDKEELSYFIEELLKYNTIVEESNKDDILRNLMLSDEEDINIDIDNRIKRKYGSL